MNKTILQTHIDLLNECKRQNQMLEKLIELNMNDLQDIVDQRDWYYERCMQLKDMVEALKLKGHVLEVANDGLVDAIKNFHNVKGRYNTQIAAAQMFELVDLPANYPENYKNE
jgi:hypothetical protein